LLPARSARSCSASCAAEPYFAVARDVYEALRAARPEQVEVVDGLARTLNNPGNLLRRGGETAEAARAYERPVAIREHLYAEHPTNVALKTGYAESPCAVERYSEAKRFFEEALALVPAHEDAHEVARRIATRPSSQGS
jgi:tetratricopeptide (TPR) repeat protein